MREILFRGKDPESGEWHYGYYIKRNDGDRGALILEDYYLESYEIVKPETIGQYTGIKDKNGTNIFENDILSAHPDELFPNDEIQLIVVWHDYGWFGKDSKDKFVSLESKWVNYLFEVVGNKFDNPELMRCETHG